MAWRDTKGQGRIVRACAASTLALAAGLFALPLAAQETKLGENPISTILKWRPAAMPKDMPDFVKNSRPAEGSMTFTPLTGPEPERPKRLTPAELAEATKKLDTAAAANRAKAARAFGAAAIPARPPAKRATGN